MIKYLLSKFLKKDVVNTINYYERLNQVAGLKELVETFYQIMLTDPKAYECLSLHPLENKLITEKTKDRLFMFLSGWLGGPNLFMQNIGPPKMRARHMKFKITPTEAQQWLYCMENALDKHSSDLKKKEKNILLNSFRALSLRITNSN